MNTKSIITGGIVAAVVYFLLGWLVYGNLMRGYMMDHAGSAKHVMNFVMKSDTEMRIWAIIIGNLCSGLLLAFIFERSGIMNMKAGLVMGAILGFLMAASYDMVMYGTMNLMDKNAVIADMLIFSVISGIAGAFCGMVMGKSSRSVSVA